LIHDNNANEKVNEANQASNNIVQNLDPPDNNNSIIIADSGATAHYGTTNLPVLNKQPCRKEIRIRAANGAIMRATHEAELNFPRLPSAARRIFIVPELADKTLMSISQLCDAGCQVTFDTNEVNVYHKGEVVLTGSRMTNVALWQMDQPITTRIKEEHFASAAIHFNTMAEIVRFSHAAMGYPVLATLDKALENGWVTGIPGLTRQTLRKHPPFSDATIKGHMAQTRKNVRSTKKALQICDGKSKKNTETSSQNQPKTNKTRSSESGEPASNPSGPDEMEPSTSTSEIGDAHKTDAGKGNDHEAGDDGTPNYCYGCVHRPRPTKRTYSDQTGEFVCESTSKNRYIYIMYDRESNHIFAEPIQSVSDAAIAAAFKSATTN
jgi:hypothetical protein